MDEQLICKLCGGPKKRRRGVVCKACSHLNYRQAHRAQACAYSRQKYNKNPEAGKERFSKWYEGKKETRRAIANERYQSGLKNDPYPLAARKAVMLAFDSGRLKRVPCKICGKEKTDAHHWSYYPEHALDVTFLCRAHHLAWHRVFQVEHPGLDNQPKKTGDV